MCTEILNGCGQFTFSHCMYQCRGNMGAFNDYFEVSYFQCAMIVNLTSSMSEKKLKV